MLYLLTYLKSAGGVYKVLGAEKNQAETVYVKGNNSQLLQFLQNNASLFDRWCGNHMPEVADSAGHGQRADQSTGVLHQRVQRSCLH